MQLIRSDRDSSVKPKLAVITSFFNPKNYVNLRANYIKFSTEVEKHANLFPIELSFNNEFFIQSKNVIRIKGDETNVLWQKERLLSIALENLPEEYTNVAWLDSDILFENENWVEDINTALESFKVVQVYEKAQRLDADGKIGITSEGIVKALENPKYTKVPNTMIGITGFGWAIRREVIDELKFLDTQIVGGADALMYFSFFGIKDAPIHNQLSAKWIQYIEPWIDRATNIVNGSVGYVRGTITHLYHGTTQKRNYHGRYDLLKSINFDPGNDLQLSDNGMWQFKDSSLNTEIAKYFDSRDEDDNVIKVNNYFDNVYVLNLNKDRDRLEKITNQLAKFNIKFERFEAIDGDDISDHSYDFSKFTHGSGMIENKYALACLRSHIEIIKDAKSKGYNKIIVFEDDVILDPLFDLKLQYLRYLDNWNLVNLGASQYTWSELKYIDYFYHSNKTLGGFALALDKSVYNTILDLNKDMLSYDNLLAKVQDIYKDTCYTFYPNIVIPDVSTSNIRNARNQSEHAKKMRWPDFNIQEYTYEPVNIELAKKAAKNPYINTPKVSVIMMSNLSNYKGARSSAIPKFIRAVNSFIHQSYKNAELIIISDGCIDTNEQYERHFKHYTNIRLFKTEKSESLWPGSRRQLGINVATGEWIAYLDTDDMFHPDHLSNLVSYINPDVSLILNNSECKAFAHFPKRNQIEKWGEVIVMTKERQMFKIDRFIELNQLSYIKQGGDYMTYKIDLNTRKYSSSKLFHIRDIPVQWEDRNARGEDIIFGEKLMQELPHIEIESPTYIVCHIPRVLDI